MRLWLWLTQVARVRGWVKALPHVKSATFRREDQKDKAPTSLDGKCARPIKKAGVDTFKEAETNDKITLILGGEFAMDCSEETHLKLSVIILNTLRTRRVCTIVNFEKFYWDEQEFTSVSTVNPQGESVHSKKSGKKENVRQEGQRREDYSR
jgi:hypothetical protein